MKSIKISLSLLLLGGACAFGMNPGEVTPQANQNRLNDSTAFVRYFKQKALIQSLKDSVATARLGTARLDSVRIAVK